MNLYTDDNPETTLKGLGFKNKNITLKSIKTIEDFFDDLKEQQKLEECTPPNVRPKKYIGSEEEKEKYYLIQKMYRVLGLLNRAKNIKYSSRDIEESINILDKWMNNYNVRSKDYMNIKLKQCK